MTGRGPEREWRPLDYVGNGLGLGLGDEVVKTRLHRARAMIRRVVTERVGPVVVAGAFRFLAARCDRIVSRVFAEIHGV